MAEGDFELLAVGPYSFGASIRFLEGFAPAAYEGGGSGRLRMAFVADGGEEVAGVYVREEGGVILGEVFGSAEVGVVRGQVERILSLDVDGRGFPEVGSETLWWGAYRRGIRGCGPCASTRLTRRRRGRS